MAALPSGALLDHLGPRITAVIFCSSVALGGLKCKRSSRWRAVSRLKVGYRQLESLSFKGSAPGDIRGCTIFAERSYEIGLLALLILN